jgi:hypothetical protein
MAITTVGGSVVTVGGSSSVGNGTMFLNVKLVKKSLNNKD